MFELYTERLGTLMTGGRIEPTWSPDGTTLGFVEGDPDERVAWRVDLATGERSPLLDVEKARLAIAVATGETPPGRGVPFAGFAFTSDDEIRFDVGGTPLTLDLTSYRATRVPGVSPTDEMWGMSESTRTTPQPYQRSSRLVDPATAHEVPSPDGALLLSTADHNLVVRSTVDGRAVPITDDGTAEQEWRFDSPSAMTAALGRSGRPLCWSPDGRQVAAYKVDLRGVYQAPQVHYLKGKDEVVHRYMAKAGDVMERVTLYVVDTRGKPPVELDLGDTTDTYPVSVAWLPDGSGLVVFQLSRDCRSARVLLADTATGETRELFREEGPSFLRIQHDVYSQLGEPKVGLMLTPDGTQLVWQSDRSGWRHYYLYGIDGSFVRQLTDGDWPVEDLLTIEGGYLYFTGHRDQSRPYDLHVYRVPLAGGEVEALTDEPGVHEVVFAPSFEVFLDRYSTPTQPPVVELRTIDGRRLAELTRMDISKLEEAGYTPPEQFTVTAADGETELWGVLFKPHDFDESKRYPVIEYIYGGPQSVTAPHGFVEWSPFNFGGKVAQSLAQLGYVTLVVDARGTPGRSKAFHDASYLRWANVLADDHAAAVQQLLERHPYLDGERVGIIGHSWGGYSSFRCLADRPDVYRAAVASSPGFDPYNLLLSECYLDLPHKNPDGYRFAETFPLAASLQGELLLAVGTSDHATWTDALKMSEALIRAGKQHEFVVLPEAYHGYGTVHDAYFRRKVAAFFAAHLGAPVPATEAAAV
jgi:dipeptidyl aminopeptidase/acylaminoacyl peptidase